MISNVKYSCVISQFYKPGKLALLLLRVSWANIKYAMASSISKGSGHGSTTKIIRLAGLNCLGVRAGVFYFFPGCQLEVSHLLWYPVFITLPPPSSKQQAHIVA